MNTVSVRKVKDSACGAYSYARPQEDALLDLDSVESVRPDTEERGTGPFLRVRFKSGAEWVVIGTVGTFGKA